MVWGPTDLGHLINYRKGEDDQESSDDEGHTDNEDMKMMKNAKRTKLKVAKFVLIVN